MVTMQVFPVWYWTYLCGCSVLAGIFQSVYSWQRRTPSLYIVHVGSHAYWHHKLTGQRARAINFKFWHALIFHTDKTTLGEAISKVNYDWASEIGSVFCSYAAGLWPEFPALVSIVTHFDLTFTFPCIMHDRE